MWFVNKWEEAHVATINKWKACFDNINKLFKINLSK